MRKSNKLLSATVAFAAVLAAPALYAHDEQWQKKGSEQPEKKG
jgi:hypothetical protein